MASEAASLRTVKVARGPSGFGLTLHGQSPCTLRDLRSVSSIQRSEDNVAFDV